MFIVAYPVSSRKFSAFRILIVPADALHPWTRFDSLLRFLPPETPTVHRCIIDASLNHRIAYGLPKLDAMVQFYPLLLWTQASRPSSQRVHNILRTWPPEPQSLHPRCLQGFMLCLHNQQAIRYEFRGRCCTQTPRHSELSAVDIVVEGFGIKCLHLPFVQHIGLRERKSFLPAYHEVLEGNTVP